MVFCPYCVSQRARRRIRTRRGDGVGGGEAPLRQDEGVVEGDLAQEVVAPRRAAVSRGHVDLEEQRVPSVLSVRSLATYLAGSQYITWLSLSEVLTRIAG